MQPAVGSTIESTGTGCSTAAMTSERRADETQVVTGCARGPDKGSRLGLGTLGAAHSPDKTFPSRSGSGGRAPSRSGFFALYHPSEPSPAQPEQNLPRENPCFNGALHEQPDYMAHVRCAAGLNSLPGQWQKGHFVFHKAGCMCCYPADVCARDTLAVLGDLNEARSR